MVIRLTKIFTFETAHALWGYDGKCKNIHGHSYKLYVTVKGEPCDDSHNVKNGMVMDFGDLKSVVKTSIIYPLDHAILLNAKSEHKKLGEELLKEGHKVIFTDYQPTCENMLLDFAGKIQSQLPEDILLAKLKLYETETSYGEWIREDQ
jgi:6-pyruvoyltetrahydropterin/6-carboxytetrahydropterin synthase